ncbi:MAG: ABC transporter substrate-binding protein [Candidatus Omnitrophota bacterium]|jgi:branched-chain amino acid transport system substrate-binding protein|nr:MAG: ABC transporter substrate-binding protein [Candidatus Omnitrophota bacterium]
MKKHVSLFLLLALAVSIGVALAGEPKGDPIKVGAVFSITGPASFLGEPERNTAMMIAEQVNAAGGINGRPLVIIAEDDEGLEDKTVLAVNKLIKRDKVCAIIGPSRSGNTMAVIPIIEKNKVPLISCAAAESIVNPVKQWVFKTPQKDSDCVIRIYEHMKSVRIKKIAIISSTDGFGAEGRNQLKKLSESMGIEIVADETYGPKDTDMTAQLTRIRGTDAEALVNWSIVPGQSIVAKNLRQLGMTIPLYQSHGFGNLKYVELAGEAAEGIIFPAGALLAADSLPDAYPRKALLQQYKNDFESKFGGNVSTFGGHAYDALWLVIDALKAVGPDKGKIRDYIEETKGFAGTAGFFNYSKNDHSGLFKDAFEIITVKDGKFVLYKEN